MAKIHEAILAVQKDVPTLEKNGTGPSTQGSYKFLAVDDVLKGLKPLLNEHGIITVPQLLDHGFHYNTAIVKDNERVARESIQAWVKYDFEFVAPEDSSSIHVVVIGEGIDTQDKAIRKATTSAWKIALIQAFQLVTGEVDPDAQDGAADAQNAPASTGGPAEAKIAKAAAPRSSSAAKPTASTAAKAKAEELRNAIREKANAVQAKGAVDKSTFYFKIGDRITGETVNGRTWVNNPEVLQKVLDAINAGEVE